MNRKDLITSLQNLANMVTEYPELRCWSEILEFIGAAVAQNNDAVVTTVLKENPLAFYFFKEENDLPKLNQLQLQILHLSLQGWKNQDMAKELECTKEWIAINKTRIRKTLQTNDKYHWMAYLTKTHLENKKNAESNASKDGTNPTLDARFS